MGTKARRERKGITRYNEEVEEPTTVRKLGRDQKHFRLRRVSEQIRHKLRTPEGLAVYKMRKAVVEPVFGQIKQRGGFSEISAAGLARVEAELKMICATHNLLMLFHSGWKPQNA